MPYLQPVLLIAFGLVLLAMGAHWFIDGTAALSRKLRIPPIIAGLVVIGMATSAPELVVSIVASLADHSSVAVGNAVGSNIANIAMVLGAVTLIHTVSSPPRILRTEYRLMFGGSLLGSLLLWNLHLARWEGAVLLAALAVAMGLIVNQARQSDFQDERAQAPVAGWPKILPWLSAGLAMLLLGSHLMVNAAVDLARFLGLSELVIGLTIVAVGTSLPELAAAASAAMKGQTELTVGNILGSNLFNILGIVGTCALLGPGPLDPALATRDLPLLLGFSLLLGWLLRRPLGRRQGILLLGSFIAYQAALWLTAGGH